MASLGDKLGSLRAAARRHVHLVWSAYGFLFACSVLFWYLRLVYWKETHEAPFSDIWGYVATGDNIARHFFFGWDETHQTYYTPVTPTLIAIAQLFAQIRFERA